MQNARKMRREEKRIETRQRRTSFIKYLKTPKGAFRVLLGIVAGCVLGIAHGVIDYKNGHFSVEGMTLEIAINSVIFGLFYFLISWHNFDKNEENCCK